MYDYIKGTLTHISPDRVTLDNSGIGFSIHIAPTHLARLPQIGAETTLYLSHVVREDSERLFGFVKREERDLFEKLGDVTGIGPKTALSLIGHLNVDQLRSAIASNDIVTLSKIPGIGKKTAERLIVEMRDKIKKGVHETQLDLPIESSLEQDALSALLHLGYSTSQAQGAIKKALQEELHENLSDLITHALRICLKGAR